MIGILYTDGASHQSVRLPDGASRPPAACGFELWVGEDVLRRGIPLPPSTTNNQAETLGLIKGMEAALVEGVTDLLVYADSVFVVNTMKGEYRIKNAELKPLFVEAKALAALFEAIKFTWVPRHKNGSADRMCRKARELGQIITERQ